MSHRLEAALAAVDEENARDPHIVATERGDEPADLLYGRRMTAWLARIEPNASEALQLAVRAQHIGRAALPRAAYPDGRTGYKHWRSELARRHAAAASAIAADVGYPDEVTARVRDLVLKKGIKVDPEAQLLEDVACLVFLDHYFADFAGKHDRPKLVDIVRKTWLKMSERGRQAALAVPLGDFERAIVEEALAATPGSQSESPQASGESS